MGLPLGEYLKGQRLLAAGLNWTQAANEMGITAEKLRGALDSHWLAHRREAVKRSRDRKNIKRVRRDGTAFSEHVQRMEIPKEVLTDRERRMGLAPRSLTAALCGDPLPGRSALERRS